MDRIILIIMFLLTPCIASAEYWVCYDNTTMEINKSTQGDCLKLGICSGFNNTGVQANCFNAKKVEYDKSKQSNVKYDGNNFVNRVVDMTTQEIDVKEKPDKDAKKLADDFKIALKIKLKGLGLTNEEADFIINN